MDGSGTLDASELEELIAASFEKAALAFDRSKLLEFSTRLIKTHGKDSSVVTFEDFEELYNKILKDPEARGRIGRTEREGGGQRR
jgi:hypothetical protein